MTNYVRAARHHTHGCIHNTTTTHTATSRATLPRAAGGRGIWRRPRAPLWHGPRGGLAIANGPRASGATIMGATAPITTHEPRLPVRRRNEINTTLRRDSTRTNHDYDDVGETHEIHTHARIPRPGPSGPGRPRHFPTFGFFEFGESRAQ